MWVWYFLLSSGPGGSSSVDCQLLPGNNFTTECNIPGNFMCGDGKCVPEGLQCDGFPDCFDKSDEKRCYQIDIGLHHPFTFDQNFEPSILSQVDYLVACKRGHRFKSKVKSKCASTFFACSNGLHCIIGRFRCNGFKDCPDGSDEDNCTSNPLVCSSSRFHCHNGRCLDRSFLCNGQDNCQDNSDEENCLTTAESPGQDFVTLDYRLHYYPGITYAVIGSAMIFVLVVALLALVLHHQRKQSVLLPPGLCHRGACQQSLLLSRLVIIDRGHIHSGGNSLSPQSSYPSEPFRAVHSLRLFPCSQHSTTGVIDLLPSYSQAVLDVGQPPWFDLPPPPYPPEDTNDSERELPVYEEPATESIESLQTWTNSLNVDSCCAEES